VGWGEGCVEDDNREAVTDVDGSFRLLRVPCRITTLGVRGPGLLRTELVPIALPVAGAVQRVEVRLGADVPVEITLTGLEEVEGDLGADVTLLAAPFPPEEWLAGVWLWSVGCLHDYFPGTHGTLHGAWPDRRWVVVRVQLFEDGLSEGPAWWGQGEVDLRPGSGAVSIPVVPVARATGRVLGPDGGPVAGAEVRLLPDEPGLASLDHPSTVWNTAQERTAEEGTFELVGPPGAWRVVAVDGDGRFARVDERRRMPSGTTALGDLRLAVPRAVTVRCAPPLDEVARISVSGPPGVSLERLDASTFVVGGLLPGDRANVVVRGERRGGFAVVEADTTLALEPYGELEVVVPGAAAGVSVGATPDLERFPGGASSSEFEGSDQAPFQVETDWVHGETDAAGVARLTNVVPGRHRVWIDAVRLVSPVDVRPGERPVVRR